MFGQSQPTTAATEIRPERRARQPGSGGSGQPLLQGVRITPDIVNNTLLIYADQANYRIIETTLQQLDQPQLQVAIDATIAEVTLTNELSYGVQFYITEQKNSARSEYTVTPVGPRPRRQRIGDGAVRP